MNSKRWVLLAFIAGAGIGSVCTWQLLKRKYEQIAQEEIDSVKAAYAARENVEKAGKSLLEGLQDGLKKNESQVQICVYIHLPAMLVRLCCLYLQEI